MPRKAPPRGPGVPGAVGRRPRWRQGTGVEFHGTSSTEVGRNNKQMGSTGRAFQALTGPVRSFSGALSVSENLYKFNDIHL